MDYGIRFDAGDLPVTARGETARANKHARARGTLPEVRPGDKTGGRRAGAGALDTRDGDGGSRKLARHRQLPGAIIVIGRTGSPTVINGDSRVFATNFTAAPAGASISIARRSHPPDLRLWQAPGRTGQRGRSAGGRVGAYRNPTAGSGAGRYWPIVPWADAGGVAV